MAIKNRYPSVAEKHLFAADVGTCSPLSYTPLATRKGMKSFCYYSKKKILFNIERPVYTWIRTEQTSVLRPNDISTTVLTGLELVELKMHLVSPHIRLLVQVSQTAQSGRVDQLDDTELFPWWDHCKENQHIELAFSFLKYTWCH